MYPIVVEGELRLERPSAFSTAARNSWVEATRHSGTCIPCDDESSHLLPYSVSRLLVGLAVLLVG